MPKPVSYLANYTCNMRIQIGYIYTSCMFNIMGDYTVTIKI